MESSPTLNSDPFSVNLALVSSSISAAGCRVVESKASCQQHRSQRKFNTTQPPKLNQHVYKQERMHPQLHKVGTLTAVPQSQPCTLMYTRPMNLQKRAPNLVRTRTRRSYRTQTKKTRAPIIYESPVAAARQALKIVNSMAAPCLQAQLHNASPFLSTHCTTPLPGMQHTLASVTTCLQRCCPSPPPPHLAAGSPRMPTPTHTCVDGRDASGALCQLLPRLFCPGVLRCHVLPVPAHTTA